MKKSILSAILIAGLIVGSADILMAFLHAYAKNGATPDKVLRYVASGVFGKKAFVADNTYIVFLGLLFHYVVAFIFTTIFFFIYPNIKWLSINRILTGILYGILMWSAMSFIVLPLSNTPAPKKFDVKNALIAVTILIIAIGIPLSYMAHKFYSSRKYE
ncbi:MAG TPA: hypothetical protein VF487_08600 [Chitinophagaceae bacterium]